MQNQNTTNNSWHRSNDRVIITTSRTAPLQKLQKAAAQNQPSIAECIT
jgi:hypothetical protein